MPRSSVQALLIDHTDRVELILSFGQEAAALGSPVLVATPGAPAVERFPDGAQLFAYLAEATRPLLQVEPRYVIGVPPRPTPTQSPQAGVSAQAVDLLTYTAGDALPLAEWATLHRISLSAMEQADLSAHLASGGGIVALMAPEPSPATPLPAVRISYAATAPVYPQVFGERVQALDLFVLAAGRQTAPDLETYYAGPIRALEPAPPLAFQPLLNAHTYLTHLHHAAMLTAPLALQPATDNTPLRRTQVVQEDVYLFDRSSTAVGLGLVACMSLLALVGAVALRRRLDAIHPDPS